MKLLAIATEDRRPGTCARCGIAVEYVKFLARGVPRAGPIVRGVYWAPALHLCVPIEVEPQTGERGA